MAKHPCVYILASRRNGTPYTGVTGDIAARVWLHKQGRGSRFCARYKVDKLVWYEFHQDFGSAIHREKCIKAWKRAWKLEPIEKSNPAWEDFCETIAMWAPID